MRTLLYVVFSLVLSLPWDVSAQPFDPRDDEAELNAAAMKHAAAGDFEAAIAEAEKAVAIRGLNIFWLNLGRFQQRAGQCEASITSYTNAMTAPPVTNPEPKLVRETAQKYIGELAEQCPAQVKVICTPADMAVVATLQDDPKAPLPLPCGQVVSLEGGTWTFTGTYGSERAEVTEDIRITRSYEIPLSIGKPVANSTPSKPAGSTELAAKAPPPKKSKVVPITLFVSAGVVAVTGLVLDAGLDSSQNGELDGADFIGVSMYLVSIGLVVVGALW